MLTHFIVASDVDRTRRFYAGALGGEVLRKGEPSIVALANSWIVINVGGPPTDDKPTRTPHGRNAVFTRPGMKKPQVSGYSDGPGWVGCKTADPCASV